MNKIKINTITLLILALVLSVLNFFFFLKIKKDPATYRKCQVFKNSLNANLNNIFYSDNSLI